MERKKFYSVQELEEEIVFWQEEKAANNEFLAKFGYSPWRPLIDARGDFYTEPGHGLDRFDFCPFGPGMPSPQRLRMSKTDFNKNHCFYFGGLESEEDQGHVSKDSFLEEFEARQRNGVFSYMDKYIETPMSECEDSSNDGSMLQINRVQLLDEASRERRSSGDQLLDDVWKQSEEYQEYLSHEAEDDDDDEGSFYGMNVKTVAGKRNVSSSIWDPLSYASHAVVETVRSHVTHSQTEVNMKTQDLVPYVKIEANQVKEHRIPRKQVKPLVVDINDGALYKRSVSAYSSLKDYDLAWQKTFHDEQHDIDKVQTTFQR
ncbi:hypothetical protein G6F56_012079 [Rhizopus delemar]|nr:hypothetical protein G6F56_012079 [Rhizopus delemar]